MHLLPLKTNSSVPETGAFDAVPFGLSSSFAVLEALQPEQTWVQEGQGLHQGVFEVSSHTSGSSEFSLQTVHKAALNVPAPSEHS